MNSPFERLWKDKMDIYRWIDKVVNGVTKSSKQLIDINIKCHYSKGSLTDIGTGGIPALVASDTLFCSLDTDLKEGDEIIVTQKNGRQVTLSVGEGFPLSKHQEFSVKRDETA